MTEVDNHSFSSLDKKFAKTLLKARKLDDLKMRECFLSRNIFFLKHVLLESQVKNIFFPKPSLERLFKDQLINFKRSTLFLKVVAQEKFLFIQMCLFFGGNGARKIQKILLRLVSEQFISSPQLLSDLFTLNSLLTSPEKTNFFFCMFNLRSGTLRKFLSLVHTNSNLVKTQVVSLIEKAREVEWLKEDLSSLGAHFEVLMHKAKNISKININS